MKTNCCLVFFVIFILAGCASQAPAPVVDRGTQATAARPPVPDPADYVVKKGETLYRIALEHGVYYRDLAAWNNITDPNSIKEGQVLRIKPPAIAADGSTVVTQPITGSATVESRPLSGSPPPAVIDAVKREPRVQKEAYSEGAWEQLQKPADGGMAVASETRPPEIRTETKPAETNGFNWNWPASVRIKLGFGENGNKGIDLEGKEGDPVFAVADGRVFYVGYYKGYGNLLIIGHSDGVSSVYAHNRKVLVTEKQNISRGQKVAEMGSSDSENGVKLHFEIRQQGKPVDPVPYLVKR